MVETEITRTTVLPMEFIEMQGYTLYLQGSTEQFHDDKI